MVKSQRKNKKEVKQTKHAYVIMFECCEREGHYTMGRETRTGRGERQRNQPTTTEQKKVRTQKEKNSW